MNQVIKKVNHFCRLLKYGRKYIGKNTCRHLNSNHSQKLLDHAKQSAIDSFKTDSKKAIQATAEATGNLIGNKTANKIMKG